MKRRHVHALLCALLAAAAFGQVGSARQRAPASTVPNFDIRRSTAAAPAAYRERAAREAAPERTAQLVSAQTQGRARLQGSFSSLQLVSDTVLDVPEVVGTAPGTGFLTGPGSDHVATLRAFLSGFADAFGLSPANVERLEVVADYTNPAGNMSWVELEQRVNGLPVFQGAVRGGFTARGELARTTGLLASGLDEGALPVSPSLTAPEAIVVAASSVGWQVDVGQLAQTSVDANGRLTFAPAGMAESPTASLVYFPLAPGVARLAWHTTIAGDPMSYLVLVDAIDSTLLFRKSLTDFQSQSATYVIYGSDSPAPLSPTTAVPGSSLQAPAVPRTTVTLVGNEPPYTFNALGWVTDGDDLTRGNNATAGLSTGPNTIWLTRGLGRVYDFPYNPAPGLPPPGEAPTTPESQHGEVTNIFYWTNVFHDRLYLLGFTEAARNFQEENFGRGGRGFDDVFAVAQESSGANNANFTTPPDGIFGAMRMYLFTGPNPDRTSGLDQEVMLHELTHGLSNRLHGNASGLVSNMAKGMGEGWGDFYARALLATADEDVNAVYSFGSWVTFRIGGTSYTNNYYAGIRRFPYAVMAAVGGPGNRPHNPLTFADVDATQFHIDDGAFPPSRIFGANVDEVHNLGEVWATALFEVRARFITRLGFDAGNQRVLQYVTDGMKLDPLNPTMLDGRDAILAAAHAGGGTAADIADIWAGFATRGMGVGAEVIREGSGGSSSERSLGLNDTRVVEAFDEPGVSAGSATVIAESLPNGSIDPDEMVAASLCMFNNTLLASEPVVGTLLPGGGVVSPSAAQPFGTLQPGASSCRVFTFTAGAACGDTITLALQARVNAASTQTLTYQLPVGALVPSFTENFDGVVAPGLPAGWSTSILSGAANPWTTRASQTGTASNRVGTGGPAVESDNVLVSPDISLPPGVNRVTFVHQYTTEPSADGGVIEIGFEGGFSDIFEAGARFVRGGYTGWLLSSTNPIVGRRAWVGRPISDVTTIMDLPASLGGQRVQFRWRMATDAGTAGAGWSVDSLSVTQIRCEAVAPPQPTAMNDAYTTPFQTALAVAAPGVLGNDSGNGAMTTSLMTDVTHGVLALGADGNFTYTPADGFVGPVSFAYRAIAAHGVSNVASVIVTVAPPMEPPTPAPLAAPDAYTVAFDAPLIVAAPGVLVNDSGAGPLSAVLVTDVPHGALTLAADGRLSYVPTPGFWGTDTFSYRASNVGGPGNVVSVTITVAAPPEPPAPPIAASDTYTALLNTMLLVEAPGVLRNDSGAMPLAAGLVTNVAHGVLTLAADGRFTYLPAAGYLGPDGFTYRVTSADGVSAIAAVTLTVAGPTAPQPPTDFRVSNMAGNLVTLRWTPPALGATPTDFALEGGVRSGEVLASLPLGTTAPEAHLVLPTGVFYLRLHTRAGASTSAASNEVRVFVNTPAVPSPPGNLLHVVNGSSVGLAWQNTFEGGAPGSLVLDVTGAANRSIPLGLTDAVTIRGVPPGTYAARLRALNAFGTSAASNAITVTVPEACRGGPQMPEGFVAYRSGNTVYVSWELAAAGPAPTSYLLHVTGAFVGTLPLSRRSFSAAVLPGTYHISVTATNGCGTSPATSILSVQVP